MRPDPRHRIKRRCAKGWWPWILYSQDIEVVACRCGGLSTGALRSSQRRRCHFRNLSRIGGEDVVRNQTGPCRLPTEYSALQFRWPDLPRTSHLCPVQRLRLSAEKSGAPKTARGSASDCLSLDYPSQRAPRV